MKSNLLFLMAGLSTIMPIAYAEDVTTVGAVAGQGGGMSSMIIFGAMFVAMYFLMIRPQTKRAKEHRELLASLTKGDEVLTQGGMLGKIERDAGNFFILSLSDNVEVPVQKQSIVQLLPKGTLKSI